MVPHLEPLEDRAALAATPGSWDVVVVDAHAGTLAAISPMLYLDLQFLAGNLSWAPNRIYEFITGPGTLPTTYRELLPIAGFGQAPVVLAPTQAIADKGGLLWEETCFHEGWWYADPPGVLNRAEIPPGPQFGQEFAAPNLLLAEMLLLEGNSWWWL